MGWNPANWAVVNSLQGQPNRAPANTSAFVTGTSGGGGGGGGGTGYVYEEQPGEATPTAYSGGGTGGSGGSGGSSAPAYSPEDLAYLDDQQANLQRQLGRTDTGLRQALERITNDYNKELSGANLTRSRNLEDFDTKTQTSEAGRSRELGKVETSARMLANSLRQKLGMAGGSGSSAYQLAAPGAVSRQASDQRGDVLGNYASNFKALDTDKRRSEEDFGSLLSDLNAQKLSKEGGVQGDIAQQRNGINENLGRVAGERAKLTGGGYAGVKAAMQPYQSAIQGGESLIDSIFDKYTTKYNVKPLQVNNTQLSDYAVDKAAVRDNKATGNQSDYSPYKSYLKDEENPLA